ncbi:cytochrome P450 [Paenibacillus sp. J22TS3]|uniref:cytochrome P450 n=1 Tax=Paenibacillus sp. J22TS3 TaxID=2807192 RepID=UPI001B0B5211|nr:cytochrome P450 [Paenibacillus sp. J22TS3]GIP21289.1 cytochrome P450 [Paenibacillus sp. J22TS3]
MYKEVIFLDTITQFKTRAEQFFPMEWYKKMLNEHPVYYHQETDTWNVFRYDDVKRVISDYEFFTVEGNRTTITVGTGNKEGAVPEKISLTSVDPPRHQKYRSLMSAAFTPRSLKAWEPRIQEVVQNLINDIPDNGVTDIVQSLASPLPAIVMADLLGVPSHDYHLFKKWVDVLFQPYSLEDEQEIQAKKQIAAQEYFEYLYPVVVQKRSNPSDDIISDLLKAELEGERFTDDEVVRSTMLLLGAGIETTSHMLSSTFYSLLYDDKILYEQLRNTPELAANAVEEMLRYRFHISKRERTVKQDNNLLGVQMKKGDVVIACMSSANVDEHMFEDPFTLNIHRKNNKKHLTFGNGPHFCLGAPLARLELTIALTAFLQKFSRIEPVPDFDLENNLVASAPGQSLIHLPMKVIS